MTTILIALGKILGMICLSYFAILLLISAILTLFFVLDLYWITIPMDPKSRLAFSKEWRYFSPWAKGGIIISCIIIALGVPTALCYYFMY